MSASTLSNTELLAVIPTLVRAERCCAADVIEHLVVIETRGVHLEQACQSLTSFCIERLGYSEDEASKRARVARLVRRFPRALDELRSGAIHLSGLALLAPYVTEQNCDELFTQARGQAKRAIERFLAARFPKPDVPERLCRVPAQSSLAVGVGPDKSFRPGAEVSAAAESSVSGGPPLQRLLDALQPLLDAPPERVKPLSASRWCVQFSAGAEFAEKLERARELLSHALPGGELAALFERALDALIERETKRRLGTGRRQERRSLQRGSRHIPVAVAREVWERDGHQCVFVDERGRRCTARRFLTLEHRQPYALGGPATPENLELLCAAHNAHAAVAVFGAERIANARAAGVAHRRANTGVSQRRFSAAVSQSVRASGDAEGRTMNRRGEWDEALDRHDTAPRARVGLENAPDNQRIAPLESDVAFTGRRVETARAAAGVETARAAGRVAPATEGLAERGTNPLVIDAAGARSQTPVDGAPGAIQPLLRAAAGFEHERHAAEAIAAPPHTSAPHSARNDAAPLTQCNVYAQVGLALRNLGFRERAIRQTLHAIERRDCGMDAKTILRAALNLLTS